LDAEEWDRKSPGQAATSCDEAQSAAEIGIETQPLRRFVLVHVVSVEETPANRMGRAGIEPATLGLKVLPRKLQPDARS
jgi:hypothetical protein